MIYTFFNDLFINTNLSYNNILKFVCVDLCSFMFSCLVLFVLYKLFYSMIFKSLKGW